MLQITSPPDFEKDVVALCRLRRLRKTAKARGFRILKGHPGWRLVAARLEPQHAVHGLSDVAFEAIESALAASPRSLHVRKRTLVFGRPLARPITAIEVGSVL
jgi:hypothetical protein